jgi:membrane AbrB-like protein
LNSLFIFVATLCVGSLAGLIAIRIRIPAGLMIGSLAGVACFNIISNLAFMPQSTTFVVQIIAGAFIGCSMEKSDLRRLPQIVKPTLIMIGALLVLNLSAGLLIYLLSPLDLVTALMAAVPGGINDTPIIAEIMGADGPKVAVMQLVRQVLGIGVFPALIGLHGRFRKVRSDVGGRAAFRGKRQKSSTSSLSAFITTLVVAILFGSLGKLSGITAATFVFTIVAVLILKLVFDFAYIPKQLKKCAQILSGSYLGSTILMDDVLTLSHLAIPLIIIVLGYAGNCYFTGKLISRTCGFSQKEAMLITTPAGASDMALISADLGVENTDIIILQVLRAVIVMSLFPQLVNLILFIA